MEKITTLYVDNMEKWMHQNEAEYTGDYVEGCLLDSFVLACKHGYAAVYEEYVSAWASRHRIEFQRGTAQELFARWYAYADEAETA